MEHKNISPGHHDIYRRLASMPHKILKHYDTPHITELVLHDLCGENGFNLVKAAYLIDNPDFDCLKGVSGYDKTEGHNGTDLWSQAHQFDKHLQKCAFNAKVRSILKKSKARKNKLDKSVLADVAQELDIQNPVVYTWGTKHDNHGLFLYQKNNNAPEYTEDLLAGLCVLAFCPVI